MNLDKKIHIKVLEEEIRILSERVNLEEEGTGHFNTAIHVIKLRIQELMNDDKGKR